MEVMYFSCLNVGVIVCKGVLWIDKLDLQQNLMLFFKFCKQLEMMIFIFQNFIFMLNYFLIFFGKLVFRIKNVRDQIILCFQYNKNMY